MKNNLLFFPPKFGIKFKVQNVHCTVNGHKYSSPSILPYIFISKRNLIIFAPDEAEIFKDYLFILA